MRICANCLFQTKTYLTSFSLSCFFFFAKLHCPPGINKVVWSLFSVWNCLVAGRGRWPDSQQIAWQTDQDNIEQQLKTMRRHRCPSRKWRLKKNEENFDFGVTNTLKRGLNFTGNCSALFCCWLLALVGNPVKLSFIQIHAWHWQKLHFDASK